MFVGAIDGNCRKFVRAQAGAFEGLRCIVGCSGNFTFEQLFFRYCKPKAVISNDVSLYSCLVGWSLAGVNMELRIRDGGFAWLEEFIGSPEGKVAAVALLLEMLKFEKQDNDFKRRMWEHYRNHWAEYFSKTVETVREALKLLEKELAEDHNFLAAYRDFDLFFGAILAVKKEWKITNTATVLRRMAEIVLEKVQADQAQP